MRGKNWWGGVFISLVLFCLAPAQIRAQAPEGNAFVRDYSKGPNWFGHFTSPYRQQPIPTLSLENSPRLRDLIHDGKLQISMADALALAIENNLDISVERQVVPMSQTDVLRASAGSAARGFSMEAGRSYRPACPREPFPSHSGPTACPWYASMARACCHIEVAGKPP